MDDSQLAEMRQNALAEMQGVTANVTSTNETTEATVETQESEESTSTETEQATPPEQEKAETTKKDLYKALGKKDKEIERLKQLINDSSDGYSPESLSLIESIAEKKALEMQSKQAEEAQRDAFLDKLPKDMRKDLEEELENSPDAWKTVQKFYKPQEAPAKKANL